MKKPKTRVKAHKATKKRAVKRRSNLHQKARRAKPLPPGTYHMDVEAARFDIKPITSLIHGALTGRITSPKGFFDEVVKPVEKMSKKELIEAFDKFRKHHDSVVEDNQKGQAVLETQIRELQKDLQTMGRVRDDAIHTRNQLLEIMIHGSKESKFPRS